MSVFGGKMMGLKSGLAALAAGLLLSSAALAVPPTPEQAANVNGVVEAETAFARRAAEIGNVPAFREFAAPGVIMFLPEPIVATDYLAKADWPGLIEWAPDFLAVAAAGDLAFASGPSQWTIKDEVDPGYYLTVWARQPDGSWKFVLDRSTPGTPNFYSKTGGVQIAIFPEAKGESRSTPAGLEAVLADGLSRDASATLKSRLTKDSRVIRAGARPAATPETIRELLSKDPAQVEVTYLGGGMSKSNDLAYTYGETRWTAEGKARRGHYVRVWVRDGQKWSILVDQQVALPPKE